MIALVQNSTNLVPFQLELQPDLAAYTFELQKREDLTIKTFASSPDPEHTFRVPVFLWDVVDSVANDDPENGKIFLTIGQYNYSVKDLNDIVIDSGMIRVRDASRDVPKEYDIKETFKVYGQK